MKPSHASILAAIASALLWPMASAAEPVLLATDGEFVIDLLLDDRVDATVRDDLVRVLEAMVGAKPAIAENMESKSVLVVGTKGFAPFGGKYARLAGPDTFQIARVDGHIHIAGATPQAVGHGVYTLLDDLGCRWYMPGDIGEVIPRQPALAWAGKPRMETPDFEFREIWWAYGGPTETAQDFRAWLRRNRASGRRIAHGHNLTNTVPPKRYYQEHPEYFALLNGKRETSQLCTSNPDVIRLSIEHINAYFDAHPDAMSYSLCPDDNKDFCECDECTALDTGSKESEDLGGYPIVTDRFQVYLNKVAQEIQKRHPGKMVSTYAYVNYSTPPEREQVDPHVGVVLTTSVYCSAHGIGDPDCASRGEMRRDLQGWADACDHVYIYEYDPTPFNAELPWPMYGTHARSMPLYQEMGIRGFSFEGHNSWATLFPNHYVAARMMWDAGQDFNELMDDVCQGFYGKAAAPMRAYYDAMDAAIRRVPTKVEWGQKSYPRIFTKKLIGQCRSHIDQAQAMDNDAVVAARLNMVSMGFAYFESYLACREAAKGKMDYADYKKARDHCDTLVDQLHAVNKDFILAEVAKDYLEKELGIAASKYYASEMGLINQWMLIGPFDNLHRQGHTTPYPPEQSLDFTQSHIGKEGKRLAWLPYRGQSWQGMLDLIAIIGPVDWGTTYAACSVNSPQEQTVQFRIGSNDSIKVWLNGIEVWDHLVGRGLMLDSDIVPVTLPRGVSTILLKVSNIGGNWGFCFRVTDEDGNAIKGLKVAIE